MRTFNDYLEIVMESSVTSGASKLKKLLWATFNSFPIEMIAGYDSSMRANRFFIEFTPEEMKIKYGKKIRSFPEFDPSEYSEETLEVSGRKKQYEDMILKMQSEVEKKYKENNSGKTFQDISNGLKKLNTIFKDVDELSKAMEILAKGSKKRGIIYMSSSTMQNISYIIFPDSKKVLASTIIKGIYKERFFVPDKD
jgi:hypothetical protein